MKSKPQNKISKLIKNYEITTSPYSAFRILKGILRARVFNKNTLRAIELYPTFLCQANCPMCSVEPYQRFSKERKVLSLDDYSRLAKEAGQLGATTVILLGGEPTLFKDIVPLISKFKKEHFFIHLVSNGISFNESLSHNLKKAGLDSIFFSLESVHQEKNDEIRGKGHFKKTLKNIELCKSIGLEVGLAPIFFSGKIEQALEIVEFCCQNGLRASGGQIAKVGKAIDLPALNNIEIEQVRSAVDKFSHFVFDWSFSYFPGVACPAGREKIGITMNGDVIPCSYNPICFGNIFHEDLKVILKRMGNFSQFKKKYAGCLCSEDKVYINEYLRPIANIIDYPIMYDEHPHINKKTEPCVFNSSNQYKGEK